MHARMALSWSRWIALATLAFLIYPVANLAGGPAPAARLLPAAAATAAVVVVYLRLMWRPPVPGVSLWVALGMMAAAGVTVPAVWGATWLGLLLFPAVVLGLIARREMAAVGPAALAAVTAGLGIGIGAGGALVLSVSLVTLLCGLAAAGLSRFAEVIRALRAAQAETAGMAVAQERMRLGRDLHDAVKQHLFVAAMELGAAQESLGSDPATTVHVTRAEAAVGEARRELTEMIDRVRAEPAGPRDVTGAVRRYAQSWSNRHGIPVDISTAGKGNCAAEVGDAVVLAAQEALANVARHARASRVRVDAVCRDAAVTLEIADDGMGFDPQQHRGHGLSIMAERLAAVGGRATITTAPGAGTQVIVTWPARDVIEGNP